METLKKLKSKVANLLSRGMSDEGAFAFLVAFPAATIFLSALVAAKGGLMGVPFMLAVGLMFFAIGVKITPSQEKVEAMQVRDKVVSLSELHPDNKGVTDTVSTFILIEASFEKEEGFISSEQFAHVKALMLWLDEALFSLEEKEKEIKTIKSTAPSKKERSRIKSLEETEASLLAKIEEVKTYVEEYHENIKALRAKKLFDNLEVPGSGAVKAYPQETVEELLYLRHANHQLNEGTITPRGYPKA